MLRSQLWVKLWLAATVTLAAPVANAQIAFVQSTGLIDQPNGSSITSPAFAAKPIIGDTLIVPVWTWATVPGTIPAIADNYGNTWTSVAQLETGPNNGYEGVVIYTAPVKITGANFQVTLKLAQGGSQIDGVALEYSGVGVVDQANSVSGTKASATIATTAATVSAPELVVSAFGLLAPASNYKSITPSAGYAVRATQLVNNGDSAGQATDQIAVAKGVQSTTWTGNAAFAEWVVAIATFKVGVATPDHFAVSVPATAVNCQPAAVTITAHDTAHGAVATTATITLSTSTGHGDWALTAGSGTFVAGAVNSGNGSYTYAAADNGAVVLSLRDTVPETVTINAASGAATAVSGTALASEDSAVTFVPSGFRFTNGSNAATVIGTRIAALSSGSGAGAQTLALQAIRTDTNTGTCTTAFASGSTATISLAYQCNNPLTCVAGQTFAITNNGTTTNIAGNPNSAVSTYTSVPMLFSTANAEAPLTINYSDAGQITLYARYNIPLGSGAGSGNLMLGSGQFVVKPANLVLTNIKCTSYTAGNCALTLPSPGNNPAANTAAGAVFQPAGASFSATVTAKNFIGAATPNFGQEIAPTTVLLSPALVLPASGHNPAVSGSFGSFSGGAATGTNFAWPEVGVMTLTPSVSNDLGSGAVTGSTSGNVGRFVPNTFSAALNTPVFGPACSSGNYTYIGQGFNYTVAPVVTVTAQAVGGATAQNYTGSLFRLTNGSLTGRAYTPTPASPGLTLAGLPTTSTDPAIVNSGGGQGTLTFSSGTGISYARGTPIVPFNANIALAINVIDLDGAAAANPVTFGAGTGIAFTTSASAAQRYGRLVLLNVAGSELLDLPQPLQTQYYANATQGFVTHTADACTVAPTLAFSNYLLNLQSGETCVRDSGSPGVSGLGCTGATPSRYLSTALGGDFNLLLAGPGAGNSGTVTVTASAPPWLQFPWNAAAGINSNPSGLAAFGVFPGPASRVYTREVY